MAAGRSPWTQFRSPKPLLTSSTASRAPCPRDFGPAKYSVSNQVGDARILGTNRSFPKHGKSWCIEVFPIFLAGCTARCHRRTMCRPSPCCPWGLGWVSLGKPVRTVHRPVVMPGLSYHGVRLGSLYGLCSESQSSAGPMSVMPIRKAALRSRPAMYPMAPSSPPSIQPTMFSRRPQAGAQPGNCRMAERWPSGEKTIQLSANLHARFCSRAEKTRSSSRP